MRILGVDPGSIACGFGVIDHDRGRNILVEQGTIKTPRGASLQRRLAIIHKGLLEVIARTAPAAMAVETPFAGINVKSLVQLAHARGVVLLAAEITGVEVFEYSPRSVKSAVAGYGAAEKEQVARMVGMLVTGAAGLVLAPDASDALAIAVCHAHTGGTKLRIAAAMA
jgi:crossover junction endodeoxyribonuclease RuvC